MRDKSKINIFPELAAAVVFGVVAVAVAPVLPPLAIAMGALSAVLVARAVIRKCQIPNEVAPMGGVIIAANEEGAVRQQGQVREAAAQKMSTGEPSKSIASSGATAAKGDAVDRSGRK